MCAEAGAANISADIVANTKAAMIFLFIAAHLLSAHRFDRLYGRRRHTDFFRLLLYWACIYGNDATGWIRVSENT